MNQTELAEERDTVRRQKILEAIAVAEHNLSVATTKSIKHRIGDQPDKPIKRCLYQLESDGLVQSNQNGEMGNHYHYSLTADGWRASGHKPPIWHTP